MYQLASRVVGGEGWVGPARGAYRVGEVVTLTATPAEGYDVIAWYGTDDDTSTATTNTVTMDGHKSVAVEFAQWVDCNENGVLDVADIAMGLSADCNRNDIPDECEADSDGDGTIDDCEETDTSVFNTPSPTTAPLTPCGAGMFDALACALLGPVPPAAPVPAHRLATQQPTQHRNSEPRPLGSGPPSRLSCTFAPTPASSTIRPFCACMRFSAWSKIAEFGVRETS